MRKRIFKSAFKLIILVLIQAFLVMDIAWAAGGDFFVSDRKASVSTLAPQLQLDAQAMKGVFLDSFSNIDTTAELKKAEDNQIQSSEKRPFPISAAIKNVIISAILFVILVMPFAGLAFSSSAQNRAQAPPAITLTQQEALTDLVEISKESDHKQLDKTGALTTIRADIRKNELVFSNSKARERVRQINELADKLWKEGKEAGTLHEYITKRGESEEAVAIGKSLVLIQIFDHTRFEALIKDKVPIYLANIPSAGYVDVRGRLRVFGGRPVIYISKELKNNTFWLADVLVHESVHSDRLPKNLLETVFKHNILTFFKDLFSESVPEEEDAFAREAVFIKKFRIIPIDAGKKVFFNEYDLAIPYYNYRWLNILTDIVGTLLFNVLPFLIGWGLLKLLVTKTRNRGGKNSYKHAGGSVLSNQKPAKRGKRFWSIIIIPFISGALADLFSAVNLWALENGAEKAAASADLTSILFTIFVIGLVGEVIRRAFNAIRPAKQKKDQQTDKVVIPSQAALDEISKLEGRIEALFSQGKNQVVIAIDGPSGAGKTTIAKYIKAKGIAGIDPLEIQVLSRDDYAEGSDFIQGNCSILENQWHRRKLVILEGHGIKWTSESLSGVQGYANPDIFVKVTAPEDLRRRRLRAKGLLESEVYNRIKASEPEGDFDIVIQQPYNGIKALRNSAEYKKADKVLKTYSNDSALSLTRQFTLDQMLNSDRRELIGYHNERHLNALFNFFDVLSKHIPFTNQERLKRLARIAIYTHDLGYFYSDADLLTNGHEQRSKGKVKEFAQANKGLLSEAEVQAIMYMIDKTQSKTGDTIKDEVRSDNRAYELLDRLNRAEILNEADSEILNSFIVKNFSQANLGNKADRQLIMDAILGGKTLALADVWGQEKTYLYMVALLSEEFRYDKQIMINNDDPNALKSPAAMTNLEQIGGNVGFHNFVDGKRLNYFLENPDNPILGMRQYLEKEQKEKEDRGQKDQALIDLRNVMIKKSKQVQKLINAITSGVDENGNVLDLMKNADDVSQIKELIDFIEEGASEEIGIYDNERRSQLLFEIYGKDGFIEQGIEQQRKDRGSDKNAALILDFSLEGRKLLEISIMKQVIEQAI